MVARRANFDSSETKVWKAAWSSAEAVEGVVSWLLLALELSEGLRTSYSGLHLD